VVAALAVEHPAGVLRRQDRRGVEGGDLGLDPRDFGRGEVVDELRLGLRAEDDDW
jgi:hypothetical protein